MKTAPITPARIAFDDPGAPYAPDFGDRYASAAGALAQAEHVFLRGNGLPQRWAGRRRFVILETGFGLGNNFLAAWDAWQRDPVRCGQLVVVSIDRHPPRRDDLRRAHAGSALGTLAQRLVDAWPPLTPNLHVLDFGGVRLVLGFGDVAALLPQLRLRADAFFLDGFAPDRNPAMWDPRVLRALGRLAAPEATAATWSVARPVRDGLRAAGFVVQQAPGFGGKRAMTVARHAPAFMPRGGLAAPAIDDRRAVVIGAGIAGASAAAALAALGWRVCVVARGNDGASRHPAAVFHGTLHADDGPHARFTRAASLRAAARYRAAIDAGLAVGAVRGLRRIGDVPPLAGWPDDYVRPDGDRALVYPHAGWIEPAGWIAHQLAHPLIERREAVIDALHRHGAVWQARDAAGTAVAEAPVVVLANAYDAGTLLAPLGVPQAPTERSRGQITLFDSTASLDLPHAGDGYAIGLPGGRLLCGATWSDGDDEARPREADHAFNLQRLQRLTGLVPAAGIALEGRVAWRERSADRLPIVGAVPSPDFAGAKRLDQVRFVPRLAGLWRLGALSGRGFTWAPLAGEVLAAQIDGAPVPLEADLQDAIDPARWIVRAARSAQ